MYKLHIKENNECGGFYKDGIHDYIPTPYIKITTELWQYLLSLGNFTITTVEDRLHTINDKDLFEIKIPDIPDIPQEPSITERLGKVEDGVAWNFNDINELLMPYCLDLDHQVTQINTLLEALAPQQYNLKIKTFGGIDMTYTVLKRQIINQALTLDKALVMIKDFEHDRKLNADQAEELTVLSHSYLK